MSLSDESPESFYYLPAFMFVYFQIKSRIIKDFLIVSDESPESFYCLPAFIETFVAFKLMANQFLFSRHYNISIFIFEEFLFSSLRSIFLLLRVEPIDYFKCLTLVWHHNVLIDKAIAVVSFFILFLLVSLTYYPVTQKGLFCTHFSII